MAFRDIATLDPDGWWQNARLMHFLEVKFGGDVPLEKFMPIDPGPAKPFDWESAESAAAAFCERRKKA